MDDSHKLVSGLYICTESYTMEYHQILINVLKNKFNLEYNNKWK